MANEVRIPINVTGEDQAARDLKKVGDAAAKAGDSIEDLGDQSAAAGKQTEKAGDDFKAGAEGASFLDKQIVQTTAHLKELVTQLDKTGDTSLLKDIRKERRSLRQFESLAKELAPAPAEVASAGVSVGKRLAEGIGTGLEAGGPYLKGVLIAAALTAAPGIGATISGAILGGVGIGGIVGGVALAAQDPRVQAAGQNLGDTLTSEFQDATRGFIDPVLRSIDKVGDARWADKLAPSLDKLASHVEPLADGIIGLVDEALPGLSAALDAAGPVIDAIADGLPEIGDALGDLFTKLAANPDEAANAIELLIDGVTDAIDLFGDFILILTTMYGIAYDVAEAIGLIDDEVVILGKQIGQQGAAKDVKDFAKSTFDAEKQLEDFDAAISKVFNDTMSVRQATINYEQALDDMVEQLTSGKRTLDEHTQAGRDNWNSINDVTQGIEENRQARVRQGETIAESNEKYDAELEALRKQLIGLGYNKAAVNAYIDELKKVPQQAITEVHLKGVKAAIGDLRELAGVLGAVAGYGLINVAASLGKRAMGGPVSAGGTYLVGEQGPELLQMGASGGYVHNAGQTSSMLSNSGGGVAGVTVTPVLQSTGHAVMDALLQWVIAQTRFEIRTTANGDPVEYFS